MCGIAGILNLNDCLVERKILQKMEQILFHRGPDDGGIYLNKNIGLVNRRLAIIDLSPAGHQPMTSVNGFYQITFNGEIYNYRKLKKDLKNKAYSFRSESDTEVILAAYQEYGEDCVNYLIGQFAFAIWDDKLHQLFLARDRVGVLPLYYFYQDKQFIFASEIKAMLATGLIPKKLSIEALSHYLSMFAIPAPFTIIKGIKSLPPGYTLTVSANGIKQKQYWDVPVGLWRHHSLNKKTLINMLEEKLIDAVMTASISDVSIGVFLSGGIDSSLVTAILSTYRKEAVKTFTLYDETSCKYDERWAATKVARNFKTSHLEKKVNPKELIDDLIHLVYHLDQPSGGALESYFIAKKAKPLKVVLTGTGGDELFGGYHSEIYTSMMISKLFSIFPRKLQKLIIKNLLELTFYSKTTKQTLRDILQTDSAEDRRFILYFPFPDGEKYKIFKSSYHDVISRHSTLEYFRQYANKVTHEDLLDKFMYIDLKTFTPSTILHDTDTMCMAHSIEARVPLLDHRLIEFAALIPPELKRSFWGGKMILKKIAKKYLPREIITRPKIGFGIPREKFMHGALRNYIEILLSPEAVKRRGIFKVDYIQQLLKRFYSEETPLLFKDNLRLWILFILELWCRIYLDNSKSASVTSKIEEYI